MFCLCDNMGESEFQSLNKFIDQIACVLCACDNDDESEFQYPNKP